MKTTLIFSLFILSISVSISQNIDPLWVRQEVIEGSSLYGAPFVMVDSAHNIVVCTEDSHPGSLSAILTSRYDPDGQLLWQRKFDKIANDILVSSLLDLSGSVYVAGNTSLNNTQGQLPGFIVLKYGANGDSIWQYQHEGPAVGSSYVTKLLLDENQNLMVFGQYGDIPAQKSALIVTKLSPQGNVIWSRNYINDSLGIGGLNARQVGNNWVFWGRNFSTNTGHKYFCWQLDDSGNTISITSSESNFDNPYSNHFPSHVDSHGNLYIGADRMLKISKYSMDGMLQWTYHKVNTLPQTPFVVNARTLHIESNSPSEIYTTGIFKDSTGQFSVETMLNAAGQKEWEHNFTLNGNKNCGFGKIIKMPNEKMLFIGNISSSDEFDDYEFILGYYDKEGFINGFVSNLIGNKNIPIDATTDSNNNLYVTGISYSESTPSTQTQLLCKFALDDFISTTERVISLSLYPNPVSTELIIDLSIFNLKDNSVLELWNISGQFIQKIPVNGYSSILNISMEPLLKGIYQIILRENGVVRGAKRIVKI
ncbi:MAG: T9SS type A sorting domain-containing protein [Saprospiraceae bacterium]|nr:T9SS type A sorting domain-containing protein [Saprospiraceae bacterium]